MNKLNNSLQKVVWASILTALSIVIDVSLKLPLPNNLGFAFYAIPIIIAGIFLGIKYSALIALIGDLVGVILVNQTPYVLFALGSLMWGVIPALLLNKKSSLVRVVIVVLITHLVVTSINSLALTVHFHKSFQAMLFDLPLRLLFAIPSSIVIAFVTEAIIEPIKTKLNQ